MATKVDARLYYSNIYGMNIRADGIVRKYVRRAANLTVRQARRNVTRNSKARYRGYPRTGGLQKSIGETHRWANQHGVGRMVYASADYAYFVHEGTRGNGAGRIYARTSGGQFGGRFPVGKSQNMPRGSRTLVASVRGQRANPFLSDAGRTVLRALTD